MYVICCLYLQKLRYNYEGTDVVFGCDIEETKLSVVILIKLITKHLFTLWS